MHTDSQMYTYQHCKTFSISEQNIYPNISSSPPNMHLIESSFSFLLLVLLPAPAIQASATTTGRGTKIKKSCQREVCVSFAIVSQDLRSQMPLRVQSSIAHGTITTRDFQAARPFTLTETVVQSDGNAVC